jgi:hypothetical protein
MLLAAFAVLSVYAGNLSEVLPIDLGGPTGPLVRAVVGASVVLGVCALLFRDWRRGAIVATALVAAFALFGRVAAALDLSGVGDWVQLAAWGAVIAAAVVFAIRARASIQTATVALNAFTLVMLGLTLLTILPYESSRAAAGSSAGVALSEPIVATKVPDRDIYLIVLDRYGSDWSIEHRFGIPGDELPGWLGTQGFQVYPGARANYRATDFSLASMLSMQMLDEYSVVPGPDSGDRTYARSRLERPEVAAFLKDNGYTYYQLGSWYGPTQTNELADVTLSWDKDTEFEKVLRESTMLPTLDRLLGSTAGEGDDFRDGARNAIQFQFRQLERLPSVPGRKFVFAHVLLPHPPYVFDADGNIVVAKTARTKPEWELYQGQVAFANREVEATVQTLLAGPDESDPIIVIMGDEGPFLCRNVDCVDPTQVRLGIRFGVLAAYYLPDQPAGFFPDDHTHVNTFRGILSAYFGAALPPLPDRSFDWPDNDHIYDFHDVTDRLPLPYGVNGPEGIDLPAMDGPGSSAAPADDLSLEGNE